MELYFDFKKLHSQRTITTRHIPMPCGRFVRSSLLAAIEDVNEQIFTDLLHNADVVRVTITYLQPGTDEVSLFSFHVWVHDWCDWVIQMTEAAGSPEFGEPRDIGPLFQKCISGDAGEYDLFLSAGDELDENNG